jgi:hypothetical protein
VPPEVELKKDNANEARTTPPKAPTLRAIRAGESLPWILLAILVVVMVAQMWSSIRRLSVTSDEIDHVHAGYRYLTCGDFGWNPEHPPLAKEVAALPLLFMHVNDPFPNACGMENSREIDFRIGHDFLFDNPESLLMRARMATSVFAVMLLVTTWCFARKMFGAQAATLAALLIAFEPNLIGHGALVTTDVPAAFGVLLAVSLLYIYVVKPSLPTLLAMGMATGMAVCLKHSTLILIFIVPPILVTEAVLRNKTSRWYGLARAGGELVLVGTISVVMLWGSYGFRHSARPPDGVVWKNGRASEARGKVANSIIPALQRSELLPEAYLAGLQDVLVESEFGRSSFLFGQLYWGGKARYFLAAATIKLTVPVLALVFLSFAAGTFWRKHARECFFLLWPIAVIFLFSSLSGLNIGFRHVFAAIPLAIVFAAAGSWHMARRAKGIAIVVAMLLVWHVASSLHAYPNYISYANELAGGPDNAYKYLAESNVDWGQGQKMARDYILARHPGQCLVIRTYNNFNADYGIPCIGVSEIEHQVPPAHFTGTVIVSSNVIDGVAPYLGGARTGQIFKNRAPMAELGGSALLVYEGTFDLTPIATEQRLELVKKVWARDHQEGFAEIEAIVASDPTSAGAHIFLCDAEWLTGQFAEAEQECNTGLDLFYALPGYDPGTAKSREDIMRANGISIYHSHQPPHR